MRLMLSMLMATILAAPAFAQPNTRVEFTTATEFSLEVGGYELPAGEYMVYQFSEDERNLFALYKGHDRTSEPIAILDAWRVWYEKPEPGTEAVEAKFTTEPSTRGAGTTPTLKGWSIGDDEWRIRDIAVRDMKHFKPTTS